MAGVGFGGPGDRGARVPTARAAQRNLLPGREPLPGARRGRAAPAAAGTARAVAPAVRQHRHLAAALRPGGRLRDGGAAHGAHRRGRRLPRPVAGAPPALPRLVARGAPAAVRHHGLLRVRPVGHAPAPALQPAGAGHPGAPRRAAGVLHLGARQRRHAQLPVPHPRLRGPLRLLAREEGGQVGRRQGGADRGGRPVVVAQLDDFLHVQSGGARPHHLQIGARQGLVPAGSGATFRPRGHGAA